MQVSLIVAAAQNGVIGKNNQLLWRLPDDLKRFKALTMGHPIIMGRKTYESIGRPLPGRTSIIVSRNSAYRVPGAQVVHSLPEALRSAREIEAHEAFIIGGGELYALAMAHRLVDRIYLTDVAASLAGDTYFQRPTGPTWNAVAETEHPADERHAYSFRFIDLVYTPPAAAISG